MTQEIVAIGPPRDITLAEAHSFQQQGWVLLRDFVQASSASQISREARRLMGGEAGNAKAAADPFRTIWRTYDEPARQSDALWQFATSAAIGAAASRLLRDRPMRFLRDEIYVKMPVSTGEGQPTPWHQDFAYANRDRSEQVNFWIALQDIPEDGGALRYLSGSHRHGLLGRGLGQPGHDLLDQYPELGSECGLSAIGPLRRGDALAHHGLTVHSAAANESADIRWAYTVVLFHADSRYTGVPWPSRLAEEMRGIRVGEPFDHPLMPIVWPK